MHACICMYETCMHACMHACICMYETCMHACSMKHACMHACMYGRMHVFMRACMYGHMHVFTRTCMHVSVYTSPLLPLMTPIIKSGSDSAAWKAAPGGLPAPRPIRTFVCFWGIPDAPRPACLFSLTWFPEGSGGQNRAIPETPRNP